jgi:hypothetical protein
MDQTDFVPVLWLIVRGIVMQDVMNISGRASFVRRFVPVFSLSLGIIIISLLLSLGAMEVLSAARAYVAGEGLWSKAQRDAVYSLKLYAQTRDPEHYERYQQALSIPLSDQRARLEMDKPDFDYTKAYSGLLGGDNHPDDIPGMIRLYRCCAEYSWFRRAVSIWEGRRQVHRPAPASGPRSARRDFLRQVFPETDRGDSRSGARRRCGREAAGGRLYRYARRGGALAQDHAGMDRVRDHRAPDRARRLPVLAHPGPGAPDRGQLPPAGRRVRAHRGWHHDPGQASGAS